MPNDELREAFIAGYRYYRKHATTADWDEAAELAAQKGFEEYLIKNNENENPFEGLEEREGQYLA